VIAVSSSVTRLTLVSHAPTDAMRRGRFHSDESVDPRGLRDLTATTFSTDADAVFIAPERRTRQTAEGLGLSGGLVPHLADIDFGHWAGLAMDDLPEQDVLSWLTDTSTLPPDGESIDGLLTRVQSWMGRVSSENRRIVAVTHPAVVRSVVIRTLESPASSFWRVDIPPLTSTTVHFRGGRWTLRSVAEKIL
jgi:broad specificity phosphatase PhoE